MAAVVRNLEDYAENLRKIRFESEGSYINALADQFTTVGERVGRAGKQIKNMFMINFGGTLLTTLDDINTKYAKTTENVFGVKKEIGGLEVITKAVLKVTKNLLVSFGLLFAVNKITKFIKYLIKAKIAGDLLGIGLRVGLAGGLTVISMMILETIRFNTALRAAKKNLAEMLNWLRKIANCLKQLTEIMLLSRL
jgi:uncharacterized protein with HEPN domain